MQIVAAYVRVSSKAQDDKMQRHAIERVGTARGDVISKWYGEKRSGKVLARPELDRLRDDARRGLLRKLYLCLRSPRTTLAIAFHETAYSRASTERRSPPPLRIWITCTCCRVSLARADSDERGVGKARPSLVPGH